MKKIAKFEKVSKENYINDFKKLFPRYSEEEIEVIYDNIIIPKRATIGSAGYDFFIPIDISIPPLSTINIPSGIRVKIEEGWVLNLYPRSSLGFKYRLQLDNTVGIIDSDYYYSDNEGHIFVKLTNCTTDGKYVKLSKGDGFIQGVFLPFGITEDDEVTETRNGGIGSTTKS